MYSDQAEMLYMKHAMHGATGSYASWECRKCMLSFTWRERPEIDGIAGK